MVYKSYLIHQEAVTPGLAGCAANKQGKWVQMRDLIWEKGFAKHDLSEKNMDALAAEAGLDLAKYKTDMAGDDCKKWVMAGHDELGPIGTNGTPAFYVNGRYLSGALPIEQFKKVIDAEKAKADKAIASGTKLEDYYAQVMKSGKLKLEVPKDDE